MVLCLISIECTTQGLSTTTPTVPKLGLLSSLVCILYSGQTDMDRSQNVIWHPCKGLECPKALNKKILKHSGPQ